MANDPWGAMRRSKMRLPRNRAPILGRRFQRHAKRAVHACAALAAPGSAPRPGDVACVWHAVVRLSRRCKCWVRRDRQIELFPCRPKGGEARHEQDTRERHADARALARRPAKRHQNEEVDRRIFEKVDAVREQRNRADRAGNSELNPEIGEVQNDDEPNDPAQSMVSDYGCHRAVS